MYQKYNKWTSMSRRVATWLVVGTLSLTLAPSLHAKKKKEEAPPPAEKKDEIHVDTSSLVWPQPPDIARIRYVQELKSEPKSAEEAASEQKKKKKQGWMDRVAGVQAQQEGQRRRALAPHVALHEGEVDRGRRGGALAGRLARGLLEWHLPL